MPTKIVEIPLSGLSTSPSDYECKDGELAAALNVFHEDKSILTSSNPSIVANLGTGTAIYNHKTVEYDHLICKDGSKYYWIDMNDSSVKGDFTNLTNIVTSKVISIGNTLIFYSSDKKYYYIISTDENLNKKYKFLGNDIPDINLKFGLCRHRTVKRGEDATPDKGYAYLAIEGEKDPAISGNVNFDLEKYEKLMYACARKAPAEHLLIGSLNGEITDNNSVNSITEYVMGSVNKFINTAHARGRFCAPFFVRYAIRMFDGTMTKHSSPILMIPSSFNNPYAVVDEINTDNLIYHVEGYTYSLEYKAESSQIEALENWKDLIDSVDIFVSKEITPYNPSGKCNKFSSVITQESVEDVEQDELSGENIPYTRYVNRYDYTEKLKEHFTISKTKYIDEKSYNDDTSYIHRDKYFKESMFDVFFPYGLTSKGDCSETDSYIRFWFKSAGTNQIIAYPPCCCVDLPEKSKEEFLKELNECSVFFKLTSLKIGKIYSESTSVELKSDYLESLATQESMTDEYFSHDYTMPDFVSSYNNRLINGGISRKEYTDFNIESFFTWQDKHNSVTESPLKAAIVIVNGSSFSIVCSDQFTTCPNDFSKTYFYYPNPNAKRIYFLSGNTVCCYGMEEHNFLNGALFNNFFIDKNPITSFSTLSQTLTNEQKLVVDILLGNREAIRNSNGDKSLVYTSEVSNPFVVTSSNVDQIGTGQIIALVPAAKALSTGQFGEYPMYAFTTDGIWALYPSDTGGWKSKQPISRDVALSSNSILQLDQSVIFATARGLMEIRGSQVVCISDCFNGNSDSFLSNNKSKEHTKKVLNDFSDIVVNTERDLFVSFRDFIATGHMHYDYTHQRIIVSNAEYPICYVFSIKDALWTTMVLNVISDVNSYPNCYAVENDGKNNLLIDFTQTGPASAVSMPSDAFILTRPIKLDEPDALKTVRTVVARGNFSSNKSAGDRPYPLSLILYASRDMEQWYVIASSQGPRLVSRHGTPYRYFRVGIISHLRDGESLSRLTFEYELKLTNKVR